VVDSLSYTTLVPKSYCHTFIRSTYHSLYIANLAQFSLFSLSPHFSLFPRSIALSRHTQQ
jgi:hypothetical protein